MSAVASSAFRIFRVIVAWLVSFVKPKIIDKYIINECWFPFCAGCGIVTGVWLGADQVKDAFKLLANSNADPSIAVSIILLQLPKILVATIPIGVFWACFLVFNRLSSDSELVAMRAGGISLIRVVMPAIGFGFLMCLISFFISEVLVPWTELLSKKLEYAATHTTEFRSKMKNFTYFERDGIKLKRIFHVSKIYVDTGELSKVTIMDFDENSLDPKEIFFANRGHWDSSKAAWILEEGQRYTISFVEGGKAETQAFNFDRLEIPASRSTKSTLRQIEKRKFLSAFQIKRLIDQQKKLGIETEEYKRLRVQFHEKFSFPFSCLVLALTAAPLGVMGRRSRTNWGYIQTGLLIFTYFASLSIFSSIGEAGRMSPFIAAWAPNIILAMISSVILWRRSRFSS